MLRLPQSVAAWSSEKFHEVLKRELQQCGAAALPLQAGLSASSQVLGEGFDVMVIAAVADDAGLIQARLGVFYQGIVAGCNCADDPTPVEAQNEYCEVELTIDMGTAEAVAHLA